MAKLVSSFIIGLLLLAHSAVAQNTTPLTSEELNRRTLERRAVDAVIWGVPVVSLDMMRQAYFRDGKAQYNDIIWWPKGATWMNQSPWMSTLVRRLPPEKKRTGSTRRRAGTGFRGSAFMVQRRQSRTRVGRCRTLRG